MVRQTARIVFLEVLGGLALVVALAILLIAVRLASGPIELHMLKDDLERALTGARDGRSVTLDAVALEWVSADRRLVISATNIELLDLDGDLAAHAERAEIALSASGLLAGRLEPVTLSLQEGWLAAVRAPDGWTLAGEPVGAASEPEAARAMTPEAVFDSANTAMKDLMEDLRIGAGRIQLERVAIDSFELAFFEADGVELARMSNVAGELARSDDGFRLAFAARGDPASGLPAGFAADLRLAADFQTLRAEFGFAGWSLEALSHRLVGDASPASSAPTDFSLIFDVDGTEGLRHAALRLEGEAGRIQIAGREIELGDANLIADYFAVDDRLTIDAQDFTADAWAGPFRLEMADVLRGDGMRPFLVESASFALDLAPSFPDPVALQAVSAKGRFDPATLAAQFDTLSFSTGEARTDASGFFRWEGGASKTRLPLTLDLEATLQGPFTVRQLLMFFPYGLSDGAREFIAKDISEGVISRARFDVNITPESRSAGYLAAEALEIDFNLENATAQILYDIPPIEEGYGVGHITGNGMVLDVSSAKFSDWTIDDAQVVIPEFNPNGGWIEVTGLARGPVRSLMQIISDSRLELEARTGFDVDRLSGDGELSLSLTRPPLRMLDTTPVTFDAIGEISAGGLSGAAGGLDLTAVAAGFEVDETQVAITGRGRLGPAPVSFTWSDGFEDGDPSSAVTASGVVDPDVLNRFGVLGRAYLSGEIPVEIDARTVGDALQSADVDFDLDLARIDVAEIDWVKPAGAPASARLRYETGASGGVAAATLIAEDAEFDGEVSFNTDGRVEAAALRRAYLQDRADVGGSIRRSLEGGLIVRLSGPFLDISSFMGGVGGLATSGAGSDEAGGAQSLAGDLVLDASVDLLRLRDGLDMQTAVLTLAAGATGLARAEAMGETASGAPFDASYEARDDGSAEVALRSGDAGFLARAIFGANVIDGGDLEIDGRLAAPGGTSEIGIKISDARVRDVPALASMLTIASLRGLSDTLNGDGVLLTRIDIPLMISGDKFFIDGARASGPALGLTASGWYDSSEQTVDARGVLVPSFGVNSALGGIPLIGDLFVSRRGEGVFSFTYSLTGPLDRVRVAVNPLSAVTPGFLRRIFEDPDDDVLSELAVRPSE